MMLAGGDDDDDDDDSNNNERRRRNRGTLRIGAVHQRALYLVSSFKRPVAPMRVGKCCLLIDLIIASPARAALLALSLLSLSLCESLLFFVSCRQLSPRLNDSNNNNNSPALEVSDHQHHHYLTHPVVDVLRI